MNDIKEYNVYSEFDMDKHKEKYINYLEIVIERNGKIHYAVPSHIKRLERLMMEMYHMTYNEIYSMYNNDSDSDSFMEYVYWLMDKTGAITVYNNMYRGKANRVQLSVMKQLVDRGVISHYAYFNCKPGRNTMEEAIQKFLLIDWNSSPILRHQYEDIIKDRHCKRQLEKYIYPLSFIFE